MKNYCFNQNLIKSVKICLIVIISLFTFHYSLFVVNAHKFHTTLTRIDFNEKEKTAEIYLQVFTDDLLYALRKSNSADISLEKTKNIDELIFTYLKEKFVFIDVNDKQKDLVWVGKELENDSTFIYFQIENVETLEKLKLLNSLFFEHFPEQSNIVICKSGEKKADLHFKVGETFKEIIYKH
jgi:hypothetical protein